jgi:hypothetical protein
MTTSNPETFANVDLPGGDYSNTIGCTNQMSPGWTYTLQPIGGNAPGESTLAKVSGFDVVIIIYIRF